MCRKKNLYINIILLVPWVHSTVLGKNFYPWLAGIYLKNLVQSNQECNTGCFKILRSLLHMHSPNTNDVKIQLYRRTQQSDKFPTPRLYNQQSLWTVISHQSFSPFPSTSVGVGALGLFTFLPQCTVHNMRISQYTYI